VTKGPEYGRLLHFGRFFLPLVFPSNATNNSDKVEQQVSIKLSI
jgi:hypothetical protein